MLIKNRGLLLMSNKLPFKLSALALSLGCGAVAPAFGFNYNSGDFSLQVDTTVSVGASWRRYRENRDQPPSRGFGAI